jgi:hypothetical protein
MRTVAMTGLKAQKKHPPKKMLDVWSESVARAGGEVNLIAQVPVDRVPDPDVEDQGQVTVDSVLRSVFKQPNPNPVS